MRARNAMATFRVGDALKQQSTLDFRQKKNG